MKREKMKKRPNLDFGAPQVALDQPLFRFHGIHNILLLAQSVDGYLFRPMDHHRRKSTRLKNTIFQFGLDFQCKVLGKSGSLPLCVFRHREHSLFSAFFAPQTNKGMLPTLCWSLMLGKSISTGAQYVTPDSKIQCGKSQNVPVQLRKLVFLRQIRPACRGCW